MLMIEKKTRNKANDVCTSNIRMRRVDDPVHVSFGSKDSMPVAVHIRSRGN